MEALFKNILQNTKRLKKNLRILFKVIEPCLRSMYVLVNWIQHILWKAKNFEIALPFVKKLYQDNKNTSAWLELKEKKLWIVILWIRENKPVLFKLKNRMLRVNSVLGQYFFLDSLWDAVKQETKIFILTLKILVNY